jgi:hypothetical protein
MYFFDGIVVKVRLLNVPGDTNSINNSFDLLQKEDINENKLGQIW